MTSGYNTNRHDSSLSHFLKFTTTKERELFSKIIKEVYVLLEQSGEFDDDTEVSRNVQPFTIKLISKIYRKYKRMK